MEELIRLKKQAIRKIKKSKKSDSLLRLEKDVNEKRQRMRNEIQKVELKREEKELDNKLDSINKRSFNFENMKGKMQFWAIAIVVGIVCSIIVVKIIGKFIG